MLVHLMEVLFHSMRLEMILNVFLVLKKVTGIHSKKGKIKIRGGAVHNLADARSKVTAHMGKGCTGAGGERHTGSAMIRRIQLKCEFLDR